MQPDGSSVPQAGCSRRLWDISPSGQEMARAASFLRTRPPVAQQHEQILHVNAAAKVEVGETIFLGRARSPDAQQDEQILHANVVVAVEVE